MSAPNHTPLQPPSSFSPQDSPLPHHFHISRAALSDAASIALLGRKVWTAAFGWSVPDPKDCEAYLQKSYTTEAWERELQAEAEDRERKETWVARPPRSLSGSEKEETERKEEEGGKIFGFIQLKRGTSEPCLEPIVKDKGKGALAEIHRLYVAQDMHGRGVGRALLNFAEEKAKAEWGVKYLWLGVWEHNEKARRLYERQGYEKCGEHAFDIGTERQTDWVMVKRF